MQEGSASMSAVTSRPSRITWTNRASGNASSSTGAVYSKSGLASPNRVMPSGAVHSADHAPGLAAHRRALGARARHERQASANTSRSTRAGPPACPRMIEGRRAKAYTTRATSGRPIVRCMPGARFRARPTRSAPECGADSTNTGRRTLMPLTTRMTWVEVA